MNILSFALSIARRLPLTYVNMLLKFLGKGAGKKIVDVGCGKGGIMTLINNNNRFYSIGVDIFEDYLKACKKNKTHNELIQCDIRHLPFRDNAVEVSLCCEVIEHLTKEEGFSLLKEMDRISSETVLVTTPVGFKEEEEAEGNMFQRHASGWHPNEFQDKGYIVRGQGFRRTSSIAYGSKGSVVRTSIQNERKTKSENFLLLNSSLVNSLFFLARLVTYYRPDLAMNIFCIKSKQS